MRAHAQVSGSTVLNVKDVRVYVFFNFPLSLYGGQNGDMKFNKKK